MITNNASPCSWALAAACAYLLKNFSPNFATRSARARSRNTSLAYPVLHEFEQNGGKGSPKPRAGGVVACRIPLQQLLRDLFDVWCHPLLVTKHAVARRKKLKALINVSRCFTLCHHRQDRSQVILPQAQVPTVKDVGPHSFQLVWAMRDDCELRQSRKRAFCENCCQPLGLTSKKVLKRDMGLSRLAEVAYPRRWLFQNSLLLRIIDRMKQPDLCNHGQSPECLTTSIR